MSKMYKCKFCGEDVIRINWVDDKEPEDFNGLVCTECEISQ